MFDWTFQDSVIPKKNAASDYSSGTDILRTCIPYGYLTIEKV